MPFSDHFSFPYHQNPSYNQLSVTVHMLLVLADKGVLTLTYIPHYQSGRDVIQSKLHVPQEFNQDLKHISKCEN